MKLYSVSLNAQEKTDFESCQKMWHMQFEKFLSSDLLYVICISFGFKHLKISIKCLKALKKLSIYLALSAS